MATKHHIGCHTKKSRINIFYCEIILNRGCQCSGVATIFLVRGGSHKCFGLWGRNVIGSKFYFVKKILNKCLYVRSWGEKFVCNGYPRKTVHWSLTNTYDSTVSYWRYQTMQILNVGVFWGRIFFYFFKSVYFISNIISCFTSFLKKKEIMYCINIIKVDVFVLF